LIFPFDIVSIWSILHMTVTSLVAVVASRTSK